MAKKIRKYESGIRNEEAAEQLALPGMEEVRRDSCRATNDEMRDAPPSPFPPAPLPPFSSSPLPPFPPAPLPPFSSSPPPGDHLYFPRPTAAEQRVLAATADEPDLLPEVELVRLVLRRLLAHLDESAGELPVEEVRRLAALLFTGARTVALLLGKRAPARPETEAWLAEALREMMEDQEL
ncbi:MAG TPA: hypothetical protein PLC06_12520 [Promineifilum sp.]|nr:hypothetical protein [Promineifilum sp.]